MREVASDSAENFAFNIVKFSEGVHLHPFWFLLREWKFPCKNCASPLHP